MSDQPSLDEQYDAYERIEEEFWAALDVSLNPRGPEMLYDLVRDLGLRPGAAVIDVGCGKGDQALELAERFEFSVRGFDPVSRNVELANEALRNASERQPELGKRVRFGLGAVEALPVDDASVELVWCRDVLVLVDDLDRAYAEFRRVLRDGGRAVVYHSSVIETQPLQPEETERLRRSGMAVTSTDPASIDAAIAAAGLRVDECLEVGGEWAEWSEEQTGKKSRALRHLARLLRSPERYVSQFGQVAYDIMLGDCFWHVEHMTGRYSGRVYLLSRR